MKCSKAKELLSVELDGELTPGEELALTRHLAKCTECMQEKAELSALRGEMSLWADEEPSEWLAQSFSFKLKEIMSEDQAKAPKPVRWRWNVFGPATAGVVTAALLGIMLLHNQQPVEIHKATPKPPVVATTPSADKSDAKPTQPTQPVVAENPKPETAQIKTTQPHPKPIIVRQKPRYVAAHPITPKPHPVTVAAQPTPPPAPAKSIAGPNVGVGDASGQYANLPSRGGATPYVQPKAIAEVTIVGGTKRTDEQAVKDNIGEAGLAMNENVEKLRGKLQEAVDLLVSKPPMPVTDPNGGSQP